MDKRLIIKILFPVFIILSLVTYEGCKKQTRCGCGKDVVQTLTDLEVYVSYSTDGSSIIFYPVYTNGATYYFCNPSKWIDSIKAMSSQKYLLLSGNAYYECNYMMQASNYAYLPPVYQVEVTSVREDNYGK